MLMGNLTSRDASFVSSISGSTSSRQRAMTSCGSSMMSSSVGFNTRKTIRCRRLKLLSVTNRKRCRTTRWRERCEMASIQRSGAVVRSGNYAAATSIFLLNL